MSDFTRRRTWPDEDRPHDWVFIYKGKNVGRCYRSSFGMTVGTSWLWTIYSPKTIPGIAERGHAGTLEQAQEDFKANYRKMFVAP
jgi:hypothetical protein